VGGKRLDVALLCVAAGREDLEATETVEGDRNAAEVSVFTQRDLMVFQMLWLDCLPSGGLLVLVKESRRQENRCREARRHNLRTGVLPMVNPLPGVLEFISLRRVPH